MEATTLLARYQIAGLEFQRRPPAVRLHKPPPTIAKEVLTLVIVGFHSAATAQEYTQVQQATPFRSWRRFPRLLQRLILELVSQLKEPKTIRRDRPTALCYLSSSILAGKQHSPAEQPPHLLPVRSELPIEYESSQIYIPLLWS